MKLRTKVAALTAAAAIVGATGVGYAYWTQGGAGEGTSTTDDTVAITVNQLDGAEDLYPGGSAQTLSGNFTNPNPGAVMVDRVEVVVDPEWFAQLDLDKPKCSAADFTIAGSAPVGTRVATGTGGSWSGLTIQLDDLSTNQDNCKNVTVQLDYTAHGEPEPES